MIFGFRARSLPTRGAWIEIEALRDSRRGKSVAPHAGSVDRNDAHRRVGHALHGVAPHAGSVDRNNVQTKTFTAADCRSPLGERG